MIELHWLVYRWYLGPVYIIGCGFRKPNTTMSQTPRYALTQEQPKRRC
jgi:hypothetical protein